MRDLGNNLKVIQSLAPVVASGNGTTTNSTGVDLQGFEGAMVSVASGVEGDTLAANLKYDFKLQHSDDNSSFTDCVQSEVTDASITSGIFLTLDANAETPQATEIGYIGGKQFIRVSVVRTGNHSTGTPLSINVVKGHPHHAGGASTYSLA
tara:strand:+ start:282 stop:734 length:453 start_codon:yes stop_codon:yes gene_type:complete